MRALIIGANGFLGSHICRGCLDNSWEITALYHRNKDQIPRGVDVYPIEKLEKLSEDYDTVFLSVGNYTLSTKELRQANVELTLRVVEKFDRARIVFISSAAVYGLHKDVINISSTFNQPNDYGLSKLAGEFVVKAHKNARIIRFTALYGPRMKENLFLPTIIRGAMKKKLIKIFGDGKRRQDYLYVKDAASLCLLVAKHKKPGIYLGAYGRSFGNNAVAEVVRSFFPGTTIVHEGEDRASSFAFNVPEVKRELGFKPSYSLKKGIKEMLFL